MLFLRTNNISLLEYANKFPSKYLIDNHWIKFIDKKDKLEIVKDILKFLRVPTPQKMYEIDTNILYKSNNNKPELLLLWLEKCYKETLNQETGEYFKDNLEKVVAFILDSAKKEEFDVSKLTKVFNENGIYLVIQEDIPGSKIRGAFRVHGNKPAIYLTYKHKRIADIYFALLHELAHCKTDFNRAKASNIVTFEGQTIDECEINADKQAFEWMIPTKYFKETICHKSYDIAKEKNYPQSFVVYVMAYNNRIKFSSGVYQKYNISIKLIKSLEI